MDFNKEAIRRQFPDFWKLHKDDIQFRLNSEFVIPQKVPSISITQITEGDYGDNFRFECKDLGVNIMINNCEKPYTAKFYLEVLAVADNDHYLSERIIALKNNIIQLYEK